MAGLGELDALQRMERRVDRVKAESIAFLQDHAGRLAPYFDDEGFGHVGISSVMVTWCRSDASTTVEIAETAWVWSKDLACGINMATKHF
jgi:hypothetical protein